MSEFAAAYEVLGSRLSGSGLLNPHGTWSNEKQIADLTAGQALNIPRGMIPPSGYDSTNPPWVSAKINLRGDVDTWSECMVNNTDILQNGSIVDNSADALARLIGVNAYSEGRLAPSLQINIALPANPLTGVAQVTQKYQGETYMGWAHFCEFEDHPPNSSTDGEARLTELLRTFNQSTSSYTVGLSPSGAPHVMQRCGFAALAPEGAVFIEASDQGSGVDQIPNDAADSEASQFRNHPSVFFTSGLSRYVRTVTRQAVDQAALNANDSGGALEVIVVDQQLTSSDWLVCVDGAWMVVNLKHPAGSDWRRPRDIWNNIWVPIISAGGASSNATQLGRVAHASQANDAIATRWQYASYFRCLPLPGANAPQQDQG